MRWIGVTQGAGWPSSQNLLIETFGKRGESLHVDLALLTADSETLDLSDPVRLQINTTIASSRTFAHEHGGELRAQESSLRVFQYDYRPTWHALLVDDDILFWSPCKPDNLGFASPQGGVEVVRSSDGEAAAQRIVHFRDWWAFVTTDPPVVSVVPTTTPRRSQRRKAS